MLLSELFESEEMTADQIIDFVEKKRELNLIEFERKNPTIEVKEDREKGIKTTFLKEPILNEEGIPIKINIVALKSENISD